MHKNFMQKALSLAKHAASLGEVPVGAVVVLGGEIIGEGFNQPISQTNPCGHAEIIALQNAAKNIGNYRLTGADLYVTLEPCMMCCGAMVHARINNLIYAAIEPKAGVIVSNANLLKSQFLNHKINVLEPIMATESRQLLQAFFKKRRNTRPE